MSQSEQSVTETFSTWLTKQSDAGDQVAAAPGDNRTEGQKTKTPDALKTQVMTTVCCGLRMVKSLPPSFVF